jgi:hypothetical protein
LLVVPPLAALEPALPLIEPPPLPALGLPSRPAVAPAAAPPDGFVAEPLEQAMADTAQHRKPNDLEKFMKCSRN